MKKLLGLLLLVVFSCKSEEQIATRVTGFDDNPIANGEGLSLDSVRMVPLEAGVNILSVVQSVDVRDTIIAVHATNGLFAYNKDGRYLFQYGRKGHGAGEYASLQTAYYDERQKTVNIIDGPGNRILEYSLDGRFMGVHDNKTSRFAWVNRCVLLPDAKMFCSNMLYHDMTDVYCWYDTRDFTKENLYRFQGETAGTGEYLGHHPFTVVEGGVDYVVPYGNTVCEYTLSGDRRPLFVVETKKKVLSDEEQRNIKDFSIFRYGKELKGNRFVGFTDIFDMGKQYILSFNSLYYFLVDKSSMKGRIYSAAIPAELKHMPLVHLNSQYGRDFIIGYVLPQEVKRWKVSASCRDENLLKLKRMCDGMSDDGNPVLLFYRLS